MVTAVRIRQSDCRLSKQDVTYPSAGILLLPSVGDQEENHSEISYEIITQKHQTCQWLFLHVHRVGAGGSCGPHVVRDGLATWRQHSTELRQYLLEDNLGNKTRRVYLMRQTAATKPLLSSQVQDDFHYRFSSISKQIYYNNLV